MRKLKIVGAALALSLGLGIAAQPSIAQFGIGDVVKAVGGPKLSLNSLMQGKAPITTNLKDAVYGDPTKDGFTPPGAKLSLASLPRTPNGGFILSPGYYSMHVQSYCMHAGTHGPGAGDGYLYAPILGSAKDVISTILRNSVARPDIEQRKIQMLIWAILSRAKFEDLNNELKLVATQLLSKKQLATLNRNALSIVTSSEVQRLTGGLPPGVREVVRAEAELRSKLSGPSLVYGDIERVAVLSGNAPVGEGSIPTPSGRWSRHPDGYWVRYMPSGYSNTVIDIWVEQGSKAVGKEFDPALQVAVPGNTARQRLAQSGRAFIK